MTRQRADKEFQELDKTWEALGAEDPLWAVYSKPGMEKRGWDPEPFFESGAPTVSAIQRRLEELGAPAPTQDAPTSLLDFGCGVGRMSRAWARLGYQVTGVDISESMIQNARDYHENEPGITFHANKEENLHLFPDESFDVVFSIVCLQHIPWSIAQNYVAEFSRIVKPGGWIAFQIPSRVKDSQRAKSASLRRRIVEGLPFGLDRVYRRLKYGRSVNFHVYYTEPEVVDQAAQSVAGVEKRAQDPDQSACEDVESWFYYYQKQPKTL